MRTFGKILEYLLVVALGSTVAYAGATYVGGKVSASLNHTSECIANPSEANCS
jgi:hypothetical protein